MYFQLICDPNEVIENIHWKFLLNKNLRNFLGYTTTLIFVIWFPIFLKDRDYHEIKLRHVPPLNRFKSPETESGLTYSV